MEEEAAGRRVNLAPQPAGNSSDGPRRSGKPSTRSMTLESAGSMAATAATTVGRPPAADPHLSSRLVGGAGVRNSLASSSKFCASMREAERGLLNFSYTAPSAADDVEAPRPESPSPAPASRASFPSGRRPRRQRAAGRRWCGRWSSSPPSCSRSAASPPASSASPRMAAPRAHAKKTTRLLPPNPKLAKLSSNYWGLLNTLVLAALPVAAWSGAESRARRRRVARLKRRVSRARRRDDARRGAGKADGRSARRDARGARRLARVRLSFDGLVQAARRDARAFRRVGRSAPVR